MRETPEPAIPETEIIGDNIPSTALYRLYDADGWLLYVDIADDLRKRFSQHRAEKSWWGRVARKTVTWYGTRNEAFWAESIAIRGEHPLHNRTHGDRAPRRNGTPRPRHRPVRWADDEMSFFFGTVESTN